MDLREYGAELVAKMAEAWRLAQKCIGRAQGLDRKPTEKNGEARKLSRPYHGPYRVVQLDTNTAHIRRVDCPQEDAILVVLDRLRRCPLEIGDEFWPPDKKAAKRTSKKLKSKDPSRPGGVTQRQENPPRQPLAPDLGDQLSGSMTEQPTVLKWAGRLRSHGKRSTVEDD